MTSVIRRTIRSTPHQDAASTWALIVDLLDQSNEQTTRNELEAVGGIAASVIADRTPEKSPIIVTCDGPRTRIYCAYDDDVFDDSKFEESVLGFDPLQGNWKISLPCFESDLDWVKDALAGHSKRITARDHSNGIYLDEDEQAAANSRQASIGLDPRGV